MASVDSTGTLPRPDRPAFRPTAPLPAPAVEAVASLVPHFPLVEAVAAYETAAVHVVQLAARAESGTLSDLDADSLAHAEDLMAGAKATLAKAGRLDLIGVAL
jgi:hypothetical protein